MAEQSEDRACGQYLQRQELNWVCDSASMDQVHTEPTLADVLSDPVTLAVMDADRVNARDLAAMLSKIAGKLTRPPVPAGQKERLPGRTAAKSLIAKSKPDASVEPLEDAPTRWDLRLLRNNVRLVSALVLLAFVVCHLTAHSFLLISFERAGAALDILMYPWRSAIGTAVLAWAVHVSTTGFNINTIGYILLVVGIVGLVLSLIFWSSWGGPGALSRRRTVTDTGPAGSRRTTVEDEAV